MDLDHRICRAAVLLIAALACAISIEGAAAAKGDKDAPLDPLEALANVQQALSGEVHVSHPCNSGYLPIPGAGGEPAVVTATGHQLIVRCKSGIEQKFPFAELKSVGIVDNGGHPGKHPCLTGEFASACVWTPRLSDKYVGLKFLDDIKALARSRALPPGPDEALFANAALASSSEPGEVERRAVVRAEVLMKDNQQRAAARIYREALHQRPAWAQGHYNLALIYGSLELYPEAIRSMRRYLRLAPDAPDARAAQDQVYAWEAFLPTAPLAKAMQK